MISTKRQEVDRISGECSASRTAGGSSLVGTKRRSSLSSDGSAVIGMPLGAVWPQCGPVPYLNGISARNP